jgi:hypothetical protein
MPSKKEKVNMYKDEVVTWLSKHCSRDIKFKDDLLLNADQKKWKDVANTITKQYKKENKDAAPQTTDFLQNGQHTLDIITRLHGLLSPGSIAAQPHKQTTAVSAPASSNTLQSKKRVMDESNSSKKKNRRTDARVEEEHEAKDSAGDVDEEAMTAYLDQQDEEEMNRYFAVITSYMCILMDN